jgi:hypothetical protein
MPTSIYDSSYLTFRRRAGVLSAYKASLNAVEGVTVRTEQPTLQSGEVITTRKQGACFCAEANAGNSFNRSAPGACGCAR